MDVGRLGDEHWPTACTGSEDHQQHCGKEIGGRDEPPHLALMDPQWEQCMLRAPQQRDNGLKQARCKLGMRRNKRVQQWTGSLRDVVSILEGF